MALKPVRLIAPTQAVVSLNEAKAHLRVDHADDDALIAALDSAAEDLRLIYVALTRAKESIRLSAGFDEWLTYRRLRPR